MTRYAFAKREPLRVEHEAFRDAVLGVPQRVVTMEQGLRTLAVVEGAIESARRVRRSSSEADARHDRHAHLRARAGGRVVPARARSRTRSPVAATA